MEIKFLDVKPKFWNVSEMARGGRLNKFRTDK